MRADADAYVRAADDNAVSNLRASAMSLRPAGASGSVETYPGGPRAPGGQASYADLADAAAEAYRVKRGKGTRT